MSIRQFSTIIFLSFLLFLLGCDQRQVSNLNDKKIDQGIEIADSIVINHSKGDLITWRLYADKMKKIPEKDILNFYSMKLIIFNTDADTSSTIFADSARIDNVQNTITGKSGIRIYTPKGNLFGSSLQWDRNKGRIFSSDSVKVIKQGNVIHGESFHSDDQFSHVTINKATAEGEVGEEKQIW